MILTKYEIRTRGFSATHWVSLKTLDLFCFKRKRVIGHETMLFNTYVHLSDTHWVFFQTLRSPALSEQIVLHYAISW